MSLYTVEFIDHTGNWVHCGKYHSVPNHTMVHEDAIDNRNVRLTVIQVLKLKKALLNYNQRYDFTLTPFLSLMSMSAPFSTRYSTV